MDLASGSLAWQLLGISVSAARTVLLDSLEWAFVSRYVWDVILSLVTGSLPACWRLLLVASVQDCSPFRLWIWTKIPWAGSPKPVLASARPGPSFLTHSGQLVSLTWVSDGPSCCACSVLRLFMRSLYGMAMVTL